MINSYDFVQEARTAYYHYLFEEDGTRVFWENHDTHDNDLSWVWPSSLGYCPLAKASERKKIMPSLPPSEEEELRRWSFFELGLDSERFLTEAFLFRWSDDYIVYPQCKISHQEWKCRGYADMTVMDKGENTLHVFEFKRVTRGKVPTRPYALQTLFYYLGLKAAKTIKVEAHLVLRTNADVIVFDITKGPENPGFYGFVNALTKDWWGEEEEQTILLSRQDLENEIALHHHYLTGTGFAPPIEDPINNKDGWQCLDTSQRDYKIYKTLRNAQRFAVRQVFETDYGYVQPGLVYPRCPWFCHASGPGPYEVFPGKEKPIVLWSDDDEF